MVQESDRTYRAIASEKDIRLEIDLNYCCIGITSIGLKSLRSPPRSGAASGIWYAHSKTSPNRGKRVENLLCISDGYSPFKGGGCETLTRNSEPGI
ncbi:hypothetical protein [Microcoleus sp. herbarium12]|uniref:hypothetical protein n=1 Tax=Microcoleus sp. herbarium12 TaxID=3055437 RepID=UPI002FD6C13F